MVEVWESFLSQTNSVDIAGSRHLCDMLVRWLRFTRAYFTAQNFCKDLQDF